MSNPARSARENNPGFSAVKAKHRHGITLQDPITKTCCFESQVGQIYHYGANLEEVDTAWEQDTDTNYLKMVKADFHLRARKSFSAGDLLKWTDPVTGQYVLLQPNNLSWVNHVTESQQFIASPASVTGQPTDNRIYWPDAYGSGRHWEYLAGTSRLTKHLIITAASNLPTPTVSNPYLEIAFVMTPSSGVNLIVGGVTWDKKTKKNTVNAIEFRTSGGTTLWSFAAPVAFDSAGNRVSGVLQLRKQGANYIAAVRIPRSFFQTATYPVYVDPTVDYQVGAIADDGAAYDSAPFDNSSGYVGIGTETTAGNIHSFLRWAGVTIPTGVIIAAYISWYYAFKMGTPPSCTLYFEDAQAPAQMTSLSDFNSRTKTTNSVSFSPPTSGTWNNSPDFSDVIQELVDSYDFSSGSSMQCLIIPSGSGNNESIIYAYEYTGNTRGAKLHIEYTEGASGSLVIPRRNRTFNALLVR